MTRLNRRRVLAGVGGAALLGLAGAGGYLSRVPVGLLNGRSRARPVLGEDTLPPAVDVVIIGGGYVGTSAALTLAERGVSVALCEKGVVAGEASGRSMGYLDSQLLSPLKLDLVARSKALWAAMNERTGLESGYRPTGLVESLGSPDEEAGAEAWLKLINARPTLDGRIIRGAELRELFPQVSHPPAAALYTPTDASVEPQLAAPAMADAARNKGASILQNCAVRGLETKAGAIAGVVTEKGPIACRSVILAGGAWSSLFARSLGISIPQLHVYLSMMGLSEIKGPTIPLSAEGYGFRPQIDGRYSFGVVDFAAPISPNTLQNIARLKPAIDAFWPIAHVGFSPTEFWRELNTPTHWALDAPSPFESRRILVPEFREGPLTQALLKLRQDFPIFQDAVIRERWAGVISAFPDNMPIISPISRIPGLYLGTGFTYGLTMGPAAGEALADLVTGKTPQFALKPYRWERFTDGSPIVFQG